MIRVCFVCLGNICRSPTAEGVMRALVERSGLAEQVSVESAGTAAYHAGEPPDARATAAAERRGMTLNGRARAFTARDYEHFDYILAMDRSNLSELLRRAPAAHQGKVQLLGEYEPGASSAQARDVPDPYYGGDEGFERVLDLCESACAGLLDAIRARLAGRREA